MLCWVDIETSGLMDPSEGVILEVAAIMTTDNLETVGGIELVNHDQRFEDAWANIDATVCEMHAGSGLYRLVVTTPDTMSRNFLDSGLCEWWDALTESHDLSEVPMAGNTIHFDRIELMAQRT